MLFRMILIKQNIFAKNSSVVINHYMHKQPFIVPTTFSEQNNDYIINKKYTYIDKIFKKNIKTVLCFQKDQNLSIPIINLKSDEKNKLNF